MTAKIDESKRSIDWLKKPEERMCGFLENEGKDLNRKSSQERLLSNSLKRGEI